MGVTTVSTERATWCTALKHAPPTLGYRPTLTKKLSLAYSCLSLGSWERQAGRVPVSPFWDKYRFSSMEAAHSSEGNVPPRLLLKLNRAWLHPTANTGEESEAGAAHTAPHAPSPLLHPRATARLSTPLQADAHYVL